MRKPLILGFVVATSIGASVAAGAGCSNVSAFSDVDGGIAPKASGVGDENSVVYSDASAAMVPSVSRLCATTTTVSCLPDDDGTFTISSSFETCASSVDRADGGVDLPLHGPGCRIVADGGPQCDTVVDAGSDRSGIDGVSCEKGSDCAPGFDCVVGTDNRSAVCRRYCCTGSSACDDHVSQSGGKTFCDVQTLQAAAMRVPVCMPIKPCALLKSKSCSSDETCAIVTDKGDTGCVETGPQKEKDRCDEAHCAAGLTCLGSAGDRHCYELCRVTDGGADECSGNQKCTTGSLFPDTSYGVCR